MKASLSSSNWETINFALGLFLWFLFATDYSLPGTIPDLIFPFIVFVIALTAKKKSPAYLPALLGGALYLLTALIIIVPPFTLWAMFHASEITNEKIIQHSVSPNTLQTATVYFRGVGAYSGGNGRIFVRTTHKLIPFLERDIFLLNRSYAEGIKTNYVTWKDNNTLHISETNEEVSVGIIKPEIPAVFVFPYNLIRLLVKSS